MSRPSSPGNFRTGATGRRPSRRILGGWPTVGAATLALVMLLSGANGVATTFPPATAPYKGAISVGFYEMGLSGCGGKAKILADPVWSPATGVGQLSEVSSARSCTSALPGVGNSSAYTGSGWDLVVPVKMPWSGWLSVQPEWNLTMSTSQSLHLGRCPSVVLIGGTGSQTCSATAYWQAYTYSSLVDLTNGSTYYPLTEWGAYNQTTFYNSTSCYQALCSNTVVSSGGAGASTHSYRPILEYNLTAARGHRYVISMEFQFWTGVFLSGYPKAFAGTKGSASLQMAGTGDEANLTSIQFV